MEGIQSLKDIILPHDFMIKLDLKDGYFSIPSHQNFLSFMWKKKTYQFTCLPFGLSSAPLTFTKVMKPLVAYLRSLGIRLLIYLDDMLILAQTREELLKWRSIVLDLLENLGFLINYQKSVRTNSVTNFSGIPHQHGFHGDKIATGKGCSNDQGGSEPPTQRSDHSKGLSSPNWSFHFNSPSNSSSSSPLSRPSGAETSNSEEGRIRQYSSSFGGSQRRFKLVDQQSISSQWSTSAEGTSIAPNRNRCLPNGLGCSMCRRETWRPVDRPGEEAPYKLSGANGSVSCSSSICQGQEAHGDSGSPRQHDSSSIQTSLGGNEITRPSFVSSPSVGLVASETSLLNGIPYSRCKQHQSRSTVQVSSRQTRLAAESRSIQDLSTDREILQLEARSSSGSSGCFQSGLDQLYRICQPSLEPSGTVHTTGPQSRGYIVHNSTMANSGLVSCSLSSSNRQPKTTPSTSRSVNQPSGLPESSTREGQQSGRVVHLRRSFEGSGVSEEAISLLLSSCRHSASKNYDSSWRVWEQWCMQNGANAISPSIGEILNFFAAQFIAGKGYNSINCYRSALSSVLPPIDGFDVGRHPLVCRILKGVFQLRPPKAKYASFGQ